MPDRKDLLYSISHVVSYFVCKLYFRTTAKGLENIPRTGPAIIASNHASYLDPFLVAALIPRQANFMARNDLWNKRILAWWIPRLHGFPIRRTILDREAIQTALDILAQEQILILYPEGTRTMTGKLLPVLPGIGILAYRSKAPVIPAYIVGSFAVMSRNEKFPKPKKVTVYNGAPISLQAELNAPEQKETYQKIAAKIMDGIRALFPTGD